VITASELEWLQTPTMKQKWKFGGSPRPGCRLVEEATAARQTTLRPPSPSAVYLAGFKGPMPVGKLKHEENRLMTWEKKTWQFHFGHESGRSAMDRTNIENKVKKPLFGAPRMCFARATPNQMNEYYRKVRDNPLPGAAAVRDAANWARVEGRPPKGGGNVKCLPELVWSVSRKTHNKHMHALNGNTSPFSQSQPHWTQLIGMQEMAQFCYSQSQSEHPPKHARVIQLTQDLDAVMKQQAGDFITVPDTQPGVVEDWCTLAEPQEGFMAKKHLEHARRVPILADGTCFYRCVLAAMDLCHYVKTHDNKGMGVSQQVQVADKVFCDYLRGECARVHEESGASDKAEQLMGKGKQMWGND